MSLGQPRKPDSDSYNPIQVIPGIDSIKSAQVVFPLAVPPFHSIYYGINPGLDYPQHLLGCNFFSFIPVITIFRQQTF